MRKLGSVLLVAVMSAAFLGWGGASAEASPHVRGPGVYCPRYDAYEVHDCRPHHRLPAGALGGQLGWVFDQLGGDAATLTVDEVTGHFTAGQLALRPAEELL